MGPRRRATLARRCRPPTPIWSAPSRPGRSDARAAEAELCRRFAPRVRLYGLRHLRDEERARDLVQSVLLVVLQAARAGRIAEPDRVDRFMLGTSRNVAQRMRDGERLNAGDEALADLPAADDHRPERVDLAALVRCVAALDERSRQIVMLSFNEDRASDDIAARLAISPANVRVVRHRAIAALRRCLDGPQERAA